MRKSTIKAAYTEKNADTYLSLLHSTKTPYTLTLSNYTMKIESALYDVSFTKNTFSNRLFAAYQALKKDVSTSRMPSVDEENVFYYNTKNHIENVYADVIFNLDIKAAYPNILRNEGYTTASTHKKIMSLPKAERLAVVGMLASRKEIFRHDKNGKVISYGETVSPTSNFFFYCAKRTFDIMEDTRVNILKNDFIFSWVDSLYFNDNDFFSANIAADYIRSEYGLECTVKQYFSFELKHEGDIYKISFYDKDGKFFRFSIPKPETKLKRQITNHLLTKNYK